jgi:hypothetical protein
MTTYTDELIAVATEERPLVPSPVPSDDITADPIDFITNLFRKIFRQRAKISREGTEHMMDIILSTPAFKVLLETHPSDIATAIEITRQSEAYQAFWTYIVCPAWEHYTDVRIMLELTVPTAD